MSEGSHARRKKYVYKAAPHRIAAQALAKTKSFRASHLLRLDLVRPVLRRRIW
jgi:hypothetical protein